MHPQIRRSEPGSCPICGMALEPLQPTAEGSPNPELRDMTRRFAVGAVLAAPLVAIEMGAHFSPLSMHHLISSLASLWIQFALGTPVVLWAGWPLLERAWGYQYAGGTRTVGIHVRRVRRPLGPVGELVETVRNVGSKLRA